MDSGCNQPLTNNKDSLHYYSAVSESVQIADGSAVGITSEGRGDLHFESNVGNASLQNVMYCKTAASNLLSVGTLDTGTSGEGYGSIFCDGMYHLVPKDNLRCFLQENRQFSILDGRQQLDGLYYINLKCNPEVTESQIPIASFTSDNILALSAGVSNPNAGFTPKDLRKRKSRVTSSAPLGDAEESREQMGTSQNTINSNLAMHSIANSYCLQI